ncbi:DUF6777 domain-containing protein [Streptomyces sp. NPDC006283]|uniref:DUF6777 domain-containing protein n=1 Tax=Streptomyces sp. NPDC006283 TaxID=3156741 RepID=UPI0033ACCD49
MRSSMRGLCAAVAVLCAGSLVAGCGGDSEGEGKTELVLQPLAAEGPDPYTASTVTAGAPPALPPVQSAPKSPSGGGVTLRTLSGATPGLYAGAQQVAACDRERQAGLLAADKNKARAFAEGAEAESTHLGAFLRTLTPALLRADTRVTSHGLRDGSAEPYQAVLQAGTAVLVDQYGAPRVRCASGAPLKPPVAAKAEVVNKGEPWPGYRADRTIVIKPSVQVVNNLLLVSVVDNGWIERPSGTEGEDDARPAVLPPVDPDEVFTDLSRTDPGAPAGAEPAAPSRQPSKAAPQPDLPAAPRSNQPAAPQPDLPAAPQPDLPDVPQPDLPDQLDQPGGPDLSDVSQPDLPDLPESDVPAPRPDLPDDLPEGSVDQVEPLPGGPGSSTDRGSASTSPKPVAPSRSAPAKAAVPKAVTS